MGITVTKTKYSLAATLAANTLDAGALRQIAKYCRIEATYNGEHMDKREVERFTILALAIERVLDMQGDE